MQHCLLFDLDQTLLDFHASEHLALEQIMAENGLEFTGSRYEFFKKANKSLWLEFEKGIITKTDLFETRFRRLFEECGCDTSSLDLLAINDDFIECMSHNGVLMDGSLGFMKKLKESLPDAGIYVITNGAARNALGRIASTGLNDYLSDVFVSENMGVSKPAKEYFDIVKDSVKAPDESYLVIGDSLSSDMLGAKNAGLASCWFTPDGDIANAVKEYDIDFTASSFDELFDVIMKWSRAI